MGGRDWECNFLSFLHLQSSCFGIKARMRETESESNMNQRMLWIESSPEAEMTPFVLNLLLFVPVVVVGIIMLLLLLLLLNLLTKLERSRYETG